MTENRCVQGTPTPAHRVDCNLAHDTVVGPLLQSWSWMQLRLVREKLPLVQCRQKHMYACVTFCL